MFKKMFKKFGSKKATAWYVILWLTPATSIFLEAGATLGVTSYLLRHKHRARKAVEFCVAEGYTEYICTNHVKTLSREEILAYIRDDKVETRENLNMGIFKGGNSNL